MHLGSVVVNVPPGRAGEQAIDVRFTYDINAALQVEVTVASTGHTSSKIFYNSLGLTEDELKAKFAALEAIKLPPREHAANKALIARAERLYAEQMGEARDALRKLLTRFEDDIAGQHIRDQDAVRDEFAKLLDKYERSPFGF